MTSAIETALTELSANLRRMEQRHQATGYKFDRLYGLIAAAREELATLTADTARKELPEPEAIISGVMDLVRSAMDSAMKAGERTLELDTFDEAFNEATSKKSAVETHIRFLLTTARHGQSLRISTYEQILRKALEYIEASSFGGTDSIALIDEVRDLLELKP